MVYQFTVCRKCRISLDLFDVRRVDEFWQIKKRRHTIALSTRKRTFFVCVCLFNRSMMNYTFPITDNEFVKELIPQKHPFVMVDGLIAFSDQQITASFTVNSDNILADSQELTASGLIEHMAQTVALYTGFQYHIKQKPAPTGYIGSIKSVEIIRLPEIGQKVETSAEILQEFMGVTLVDITSEIDGEVIAKAQMKTVLAK